VIFLENMEDISGLCGRLSLTDKEEMPFDFGFEEDDQFYLAARFMTGRHLNIESVVRTFRPLWRTAHGFTVRDMGNNVLVFAFEDETDLERVMQGEPWSYDKYLVSFQRVDVDTDVTEMECGFVSFWVQIHNLPIGRMKREFAVALGTAMGEVEHVAESEEERGCEGCMRIRVRIDISKPLCRGRKARLASGRETWISFKYERLPIFCYWCGCLTHGDKDCEVWLKNKGVMRREDQQYGAWLRASFDKPVRRIEVKVAGRSNVPRWGQKSEASNSVSSENKAYEDSGLEQQTQKIKATGLGSEESGEVMEQSPSIKVHSCEPNRDFERDIREIDEALHDSPPNVELPNQESASRELGKPKVIGTQGSEVDKAVEELRNCVVTQDILGTKATEGDTLVTQNTCSGKEKLYDHSLSNAELNIMHEVKVHGESRGTWRRLSRAIAGKKVGSTKISGVKRAGDRMEGQKQRVHGKKKSRDIVTMDGIEVDGGLAEAEQQPRRTQ
jgi:hypothetical protein